MDAEVPDHFNKNLLVCTKAAKHTLLWVVFSRQKVEIKTIADIPLEEKCSSPFYYSQLVLNIETSV